MPFPQTDITSPPQAQFETLINENFRAVAPASAFSKKANTTSGLTFGYYGAVLDGVVVADGTVSLTASATNYVVVNRGTGVVSTSTATTNWNDQVNYARLYRLITNTTAVTTEEDHRVGSKGLFGNAGAGLTAVTSVDALGGVETVAGTPITATGTVRSAKRRNAQTGTTYTVVTADRGKTLTFNNAAAVNVTQPQAGTDFPDGWYVEVKNIGVGTVTITPTTSTVDGGANVTLATGQSLLLASDGTNYQTFGGKSAGGLTSFVDSRATTSPNATINVSVLSVTDGTTDGDVAIVAKGTGGATLAQVPDSAAAGGNKRGARATDFQKTRAAATAVASGIRSVIVGGQNNTASGTDSSVLGGSGNSATANQSSVLGGSSNTASGGSSAVICGDSNTASGTSCAVTSGNNNVASGQYAEASGLQASSRGLIAHRARASGQFSAVGDAQAGSMVLRRFTTDATPTPATADGNAAGTANQLVLPSTAGYAVTGLIVARGTSSNDFAAWTFSALVKSVAGTVSMVGSATVTQIAADAGASGWAVAILADNTNKAVQAQVTGAASTNIRWVVSIESAEVA